MKTELNIEYWNILTDRRGLLVECMKPDFLKLNAAILGDALEFANGVESCTSVIVKKHPAHGDVDFAWRVYPSEYRLYIYYGVGEERSFHLKKTGGKK